MFFYLFQLSESNNNFSDFPKLNQIFTLEFPCKNTTLGDGKDGAILTGTCEKGKEGTITYQCISREWREMNRDCILQVIKNIENIVEVIFIIYALVKKLNKIMSF